MSVSKGSRGLSEQCVSVILQYNETDAFVRCHSFLLSPKNCLSARKEFCISSGNEIKCMHSDDIIQFHPMPIKTHIISRRTSTRENTHTAQNHVSTGLSFLSKMLGKAPSSLGYHIGLYLGWTGCSHDDL